MNRTRPSCSSHSRLRATMRGWTTPPNVVRWGRLLGLGARDYRSPVRFSIARSILVVRPDGIGDVVMTTPLLRELRRLAPSARVTLAVAHSSLSLTKLCPDIDDVIVVAPVPHGRGASLRRIWTNLQQTRCCRREGIDIAIYPRWDVDYYFGGELVFFSDAAARVGFSERVNKRKALINAGTDRFLTHVVSMSRYTHEVDKNLDLLRHFAEDEVHFGEPMLRPTAGDLAEARSLLIDNDIAIDAKRTLVAVAIGAQHPRRRWPVDRFAAVAKKSVANFDANVLLIGSDADRSAAYELLSLLGPERRSVVDCTGRLSLSQLAALMRLCSVFVGNDSGPAHIAGAVGVPTITITCHPIGASDDHHNSPARFRVRGAKHCTLRPIRHSAPCRDGCEANQAHCIMSVNVSAVCEALKRAIAQEN